MCCFQKLESLTLFPLATLHTALEKFCEAMPQMTKLSLPCMYHKNKYDGVLRAIAANMHHLKYLNISWCTVEPKAIEYLLTTKDNVLGGCPELVHLDLWGVENVGVELLKKIIIALPKLRFLRHRLLVDALGDLKEEEMAEDTARYLNITYCVDRLYSIRYDSLVKSPIFHRFNNNITTAVIEVSAFDRGRQETVSLGDALMSLPKLRRLMLSGISEAHKHLLPLLESIGDRLVLVELSGLSGNLSVLDIMRTCPNVVELELYYLYDSLGNGSNKLVQHNQIKSTSKLPVLHCLTKVTLGNMNKEMCSSDMLIALMQSPNLNKINLSNLEAMTDDVMFNALSSRSGAELLKVIRFSVSRCPWITEAPFVRWITSENCSLQHMLILLNVRRLITVSLRLLQGTVTRLWRL